MTNIEKAIIAAGGAKKVADTLGLSKSAVSQWRRRASIPAHYVVELCGLTKGAFSPDEIRPDIFGK